MNVVSSIQEGIEHFVLLARVSDTPGNSGVIVGEAKPEPTTTVALGSGSFQNFNGKDILLSSTLEPVTPCLY